MTGNLELAKYLCSMNVDVNAKDDNEDTPYVVYLFMNKTIGRDCLKKSSSLTYIRLHYAAANNFPEVIALLIAHGADVRAKNLDQVSPYVRIHLEYALLHLCLYETTEIYVLCSILQG